MRLYAGAFNTQNIVKTVRRVKEGLFAGHRRDFVKGIDGTVGRT
jgi:hypothetical protein